MKIIKATTAKGTAMLNSAKNYEGYTLADVYDNYSEAKKVHGGIVTTLVITKTATIFIFIHIILLVFPWHGKLSRLKRAK